MCAVTVLVAGVRVSRHEGLLIRNSRERKNAMIQICMIAHAAIDQRHSDAGPGKVRLPREICIHRRRGAVERRKHRPILADVYDVWVVRQVHNAIAIKQRDDAVDQRQLSENRSTQLQDIVHQAADKTEQSATVHLRSRRVLHDDLYLLGRLIAAQFRRYL